MLAITTAAFGQKDILLYSTDFSDWGTVSYVETEAAKSANYTLTSGGGKGFALFQGSKPELNSSAMAGALSSAGCQYGVGFASQPGNSLIFPSFDFVNGGVVEIELRYGKNGRVLEIPGTTASIVSLSGSTPKPADVSNTSGAKFNSGKDFGVAVVDYTFTGAGAKELNINATGKYSDYFIISKISIYSSVGNTPYVAAVDYPNAGQDGSKTSEAFKLQGEVGGPQVSGNVLIKGYNLTGDVTFSVVGQDAAKFSLGATTMSAADALAGTNSVAVNFMPSVKSGSSSAMLKISSGTNDYYVNLVGVSGSTDPQIVANTAPLNFWTYQTGKFSQLLNVSGMNLNGPVTAKLEGEGAINFSLSTSEISAYDAAKGFVLNITFTGDINEGTKTANLVLSSPGAPSVSIPLSGITSIVKPETFTVDFSVSPAGSGYIDLNPGGRVFKKGTVVKASVATETGYSIASWSDNAGSRRAERTFTISETTPQSIVVNLTKGGSGGGGGETAATSSFVAMPATNVTANSMTANWSAASSSDATVAVTYTVTLYDANGNQIDQQAGLTTTTADFSGLTPNTAYTYKVTSTSTDAGQTETARVGPFYTVDDTVYVCGE